MGVGTLSFEKIGGIVLFNKVAILINSLLVSSPYIRLSIFDCGDLKMPRRSAAAYLRYVSGVMAGKGICCGKIHCIYISCCSIFWYEVFITCIMFHSRSNVPCIDSMYTLCAPFLWFGA